MADSNNIDMEYVKKLESRVTELEERLERIVNIMEHIESDIYDDDFDFEIVCPYCNHEFVVDFDENTTEITCPECENKIELDWSCDCDDEHDDCSGHCCHCDGCDDEDEDDM